MSEKKPAKMNDSSQCKNIIGQGQISLDTLVQALTDHQLSEIEYEENGCRVYLSRQASQQVVAMTAPGGQPPVTAPQPAPASAEKPSAVPTSEPTNLRNHPGVVKAPMVGVVYVAPEPGAEPFVRVGDTVNPGQTLLIIEAMKVLNPIKASKAGKVLEIFVHNQKPVEYDEPLLVISD